MCVRFPGKWDFFRVIINIAGKVMHLVIGGKKHDDPSAGSA